MELPWNPNPWNSPSNHAGFQLRDVRMLNFDMQILDGRNLSFRTSMEIHFHSNVRQSNASATTSR